MNPNSQRPDTNIPGQTPPKTGYTKRNVRGSGALILSRKTGRLLFAFRSTKQDGSKEWNFWGGKVPTHESPEDSVVFWSKKQTGYTGNFVETIPLYSFLNAFTNFRYYIFLLVVDDEFIPRLDKTFIHDYKWANIDNIPTPLNSLVKTFIDRTNNKIKDIIEKDSIKENLSINNTIKLKDLIRI